MSSLDAVVPQSATIEEKDGFAPILEAVQQVSQGMPSSEVESEARSVLHHTDGLATGSIVAAFGELGLADLLSAASKPVPFTELEAMDAVQGPYLRTSLRSLAIVGLVRRVMDDRGEVRAVELTSEGRGVMRRAEHYRQAHRSLLTAREAQQILIGRADVPDEWLESHGRQLRGWDLESGEEIVARHLEGLLLGPIVSALQKEGLHEAERLDRERHPIPSAFLAALEHQGWYARDPQGWAKTPRGRIALSLSVLYGVPVSYLPILRRIPGLLAGKTSPAEAWKTAPDGSETHIDRPLNLSSTSQMFMRRCPSLAGKQREFFQSVLRALFDDVPLPEQPRFLCDMGCGNGLQLVEMYRYVRDHTLRGRNLEDYPLMVIGADISPEALQVASGNLDKERIPHVVCSGDIGDPGRLEKDLQERGLSMKDGLHMRAFLDHNRIFKDVHDREAARRREPPISRVGAFIDQRGRYIPSRDLQQDLVEHFDRWSRHVGRFGLIALELNTFDDEVMSGCPGRHRYLDIVHLWSSQYVTEREVFLNATREVGFGIKHSEFFYNTMFLWLTPHPVGDRQGG
jgi:hypothetical protein